MRSQQSNWVDEKTLEPYLIVWRDRASQVNWEGGCKESNCIQVVGSSSELTDVPRKRSTDHRGTVQEYSQRTKGTLGITDRTHAGTALEEAIPRCRLRLTGIPGVCKVGNVPPLKVYVSWVNIRANEVRFSLPKKIKVIAA